MDAKKIVFIINQNTTDFIHPLSTTELFKVVSERRLALYSWLDKLLKNAGANIVASDDIPILQLLQNFGENTIDMCTLFTDGHSGANLLGAISEKIKQIRSISPNIGILLVSTNRINSLNPNLLPARTWLITPITLVEDIKTYFLESRYALNNNSFYFRSFNQTPFCVVREKRDNRCTSNWPLPNLNVKHPAMLLPIANVAARNNTPVYVEISPQEALVNYDYIGTEYDVYKKLSKVFESIKSDVDLLKEQKGVQIFLHLDHCNDVEIIKRALDCGFNSIMADGSNQTLKANIRFVQAIKKISEPYDVPIEGEIGAIDLSGFRKKSTTICSELKLFVESTNIDYIGVNIGQVHGSDYGFDRSREAYLKYSEYSQKKNYQSLNLLESCIEIDDILEQKEYPIHSLERTTIKELMDRIVLSREDEISITLSPFMSSPSISINYWLNELMMRWNEKQMNIIEENRQLLQQILGLGMKNDAIQERNVDFDLLASIAEILNGETTKIVLHGGSSISKEDLKYLAHYGVKRVNFGSRPFQLFINSLRNEAMGRYNYKNIQLKDNPLETSFFVNKYAAKWKNWIDKAPSFLIEYEYELENQFFSPILNKYKGV